MIGHYERDGEIRDLTFVIDPSDERFPNEDDVNPRRSPSSAGQQLE